MEQHQLTDVRVVLDDEHRPVWPELVDVAARSAGVSCGDIAPV